MLESLSLLIPVAVVLAGALASLMAEPFLGRAGKHAWLPWAGVLTLVVAGIAQCQAGPGHLHGLFAMDQARAWLCLAILTAAGCAMAGLQQTLARDHHEGGEPYVLILTGTAGAMLMTMAADALALFVALELASLSIYVLVGLRRQRTESGEALFKYLVMGAVFSAVFLYGMALSYGATGGTRFGLAALAGREQLWLLGHALMVVALLFKVGVVPFHAWSPDAYTGAPAAITGFMGAVIKVGGFAALGALWLSMVSVAGGAPVTVPVALDAPVALTVEAAARLRPFGTLFLVLGLLSIVLGNFAALRQTSARRLVAYSSIAHAGYMLLALVPPLATGAVMQVDLGSLWLYALGYAIATAGALSAIAALSGRDDLGDTLSGLAGQGRTQPLMGLVLTVFVASFAGLPPTLGFLGKFQVFADLVAKDRLPIALFALLMAVVGMAAYLRVLLAVWSAEPKAKAETGPNALGSWALAAAAIAVIALCIMPNAVTGKGPAVVPVAKVSAY